MRILGDALFPVLLVAEPNHGIAEILHTVGLHAVALLTKPFAVSLPVVMLAMDFFPLRRHAGRSAWRCPVRPSRPTPTDGYAWNAWACW